jgi:hypothetical protein
MFEELKKYYDLQNNIEENEISRIEILKNEENYKNKFALNLLNEEYFVLSDLFELEKENFNFKILENIKLDSILNLLVIYNFLFSKNQNEQTNYNLKNLSKQIKEKLNEFSGINLYGYDFLFMFCLIENLDFKTYSMSLENSSRVFDFEVCFVSSKNEIEEYLKIKKHDLNMKNLYIIFNISNYTNKLKELTEYITERKVTSSSMNFNKTNEEKIYSLINYENLNLKKFFKDTNYSYKFLTTNIIIDIKELNSIDSIDIYKSITKKETKVFGINEKKFIEDIQKYDLFIFPEYKNKIDLMNSNLILKEKLYIFDKILEKNNHERDSYKYILYNILKNENIKFDENFFKFKHIYKFIEKIFEKDLLEFENSSKSLYYRRKKFDLIILLKDKINENFIKKFLNFKNIDTNNKIEKLTVFLLSDFTSFISRKELEKLISKNFNLDSLLFIHQELESAYFHNYFMNYKEFLKIKIIKLILFEYLITKKNNIIIYKYFLEKIKPNFDFDILLKFKEYLIKNKKYFIKLNNIKINEFFLNEKIISKKLFLDKLITKLNNLKYDEDYMNYIQYVLIDKNYVYPKLNKEIRFFDSLEKKEYKYTLNLLNENLIDFLKNKKILSKLVSIKNLENNISFLEYIIKETNDISLVSTILKLSKYLNISIDNYYKENFYYMFEEDVEKIFEID